MNASVGGSNGVLLLLLLRCIIEQARSLHVSVTVSSSGGVIAFSTGTNGDVAPANAT